VLLGLRDRLRSWLRGQALVVQEKADVHLHLHRITNDGVELSVSLFLATASAAEETRFREEINCEVLAQALGVRLAPTCVGSPAGTAGGSLQAA
jgi:hypothetical protein